MKVIRTALLLFTAAALMFGQQPGIGQNGVVNTASQIAPTLAGGAIARGARFTIYGVRLGSSAITLVTAGRTPIKTLTVTRNRIDAVMPVDIPLGSVPLVVTVGASASKPFTTEIVDSNPGLYSRNGEGWGPGVIRNLTPGAQPANNTESSAALPGQSISLGVTGLGGARQVTVVIGTHPVTVSTRPHQEELQVRLPAGAEQGCYVPVYLLASPSRASNVVTVSIASRAGACNPGPVPILNSRRVGVGIASRTRFRGRAGEPVSVKDEAILVFASKDEQPVSTPILLLPPVGTCTAYTSSFQADTALQSSMLSALFTDMNAHGLDAGPSFTIAGNGQTRSLLPVLTTPGYYKGRLGWSEGRQTRRNPGLFLNSGEFVIDGPGGPDVGPVHASLRAPVPLEWSNLEQTTTVDRSKPLPIRWTGLSSGHTVIIIVTNVDQLSTAIGTSMCVADGKRGELTIPAALLANIPVSRDMPGLPYDQVFVSQLPSTPAPRIQARGLDGGFLVSLYTIGRFVVYR